MQVIQQQFKLEGGQAREAAPPVALAEVRGTRYHPCSRCGAMIADRTPTCGFCGRRQQRNAGF